MNSTLLTPTMLYFYSGANVREICDQLRNIFLIAFPNAQDFSASYTEIMREHNLICRIVIKSELYDNKQSRRWAKTDSVRQVLSITVYQFFWKYLCFVTFHRDARTLVSFRNEIMGCMGEGRLQSTLSLIRRYVEDSMDVIDSHSRCIQEWERSFLSIYSIRLQCWSRCSFVRIFHRLMTIRVPSVAPWSNLV